MTRRGPVAGMCVNDYKYCSRLLFIPWDAVVFMRAQASSYLLYTILFVACNMCPGPSENYDDAATPRTCPGGVLVVGRPNRSRTESPPPRVTTRLAIDSVITVSIGCRPSRVEQTLLFPNRVF